MVKSKKYVILWSDMAKLQLKEIYRHIKKDSEQSAKQVKTKILASTKILELGKEVYKSDVLKINNDGTYRAYMIYSYRIVYKINEDSINILRIRHTSREPLEY